MSVILINFKKAFILYGILWLVYGLLLGFLSLWIWVYWSMNLWSLSNEEIRYIRNFAIIFGVSYWLVSLVLWVVAGYVSLVYFVERSSDDNRDHSTEEIERTVTSELSSKVKNYHKEADVIKVNGNEKAAFCKDSKCYSSFSEHLRQDSSDFQSGDVLYKRSVFQSKSEVYQSLDMWEDDVLKVPNDPSVSVIASDPQNKNRETLLDRRISREDSYKGLPALKSFDKYLQLATIDSPLTARELFFIDLIRMEDEKERLEAIQQFDRRFSSEFEEMVRACRENKSEELETFCENDYMEPSLELEGAVGICSRDKSDSNFKLETIHEVRVERDSLGGSFDSADASFGEFRGGTVDERFLPTVSRN